MMQKYARIFGKKEEEWTRYWLSVSTEKLNKKGKGTGEYMNANIPVRMTEECADTWAEIATPTRNKRISMANCSIDFFLKVFAGKDEDIVGVFVYELEPAPSKEDDE